MLRCCRGPLCCWLLVVVSPPEPGPQLGAGPAVLQVFIEVDPPSHFSTNSHRPLGRTVGRRCMLEACGYTVRSIAYYEWATLESDALQQAYLTRLLASCF